MSKILLCGGSFDPPHYGHINTIKRAAKELNIERVIIIPAARPPHKNKVYASFSDRTEMCRLAFPDCTVSETEKNLSGKSFTVNTVRTIKNELPKDTKIYFIIGSDSLFDFENWYRYDAILNECIVVAAAREEHIYTDMLEHAAKIGKIKVLNLPVTEISSTEIRGKIKRGEDVTGLLPEKVYSYIKEKGLYL
jgi:nicotinate-nucleotide adenylyltransferase